MEIENWKITQIVQRDNLLLRGRSLPSEVSFHGLTCFLNQNTFFPLKAKIEE